jgi:ankyrin repeat protein
MRSISKKNIFLILLLFFTFSLNAQENTLLDRNFWKDKPILKTVKEKVKEGNDPSAFNRFSFDPVVYAILEKAPMETLKFLLSQSGNGVNKITHDGRSYLFWAAYKDNLPLMKHLISEGAKTDIIDDHGNSVLNFAAATGQKNPELYNYLLEQDTNALQKRATDGANALLLLLPHLESQRMVTYFENKGLKLSSNDDQGNGAFNYAAQGGKLEMLDWLLNEEVDIEPASRSGENAMHFASRGTRGHSNSLEVFEYLKDKGIAPDLQSTKGTTPLMIYAAKAEDPEVISFFLTHGANPDQADNDGNTALMNASKNSTFECVQLLVAKAENINATNKEGQTALSNAVQHNSAQTVRFLIKQGGGVNSTDERGRNLLYYLVQSFNPNKEAAFKEKLEIIDQNGLPITAEQGNKDTFFHLAARKNSLALLKMAREKELDINAQNQAGLTPLHIAAMKAHNDEILKYLIANGADKGISTSFDESAFQLAGENELLLDSKTDLNFLKN